MSKSKKVKMFPLRLEYSEGRSGGEICEGQEDDAWTNHEPTNIDTTFKYLVALGDAEEVEDCSPLMQERYSGKFFSKEDPRSAGNLFLTVVKYHDGGTFGSVYGYWTVVYVGTDELEAHRIKKAVETKSGDFKTGQETPTFLGKATLLGLKALTLCFCPAPRNKVDSLIPFLVVSFMEVEHERSKICHRATEGLARCDWGDQPFGIRPNHTLYGVQEYSQGPEVY